ncbi:MAG TPA: hypothetical protein VIX80_00055, partial [Candidatus Kapabacteria bacterium]
MKRFLILMFFITIAASISAQTTSTDTVKKILFAKKSWELSILGSFNSQSVTTYKPVDDLGIFTLSVSAARYIFDCFYLEPEVTMRLVFSDGAGGAEYQLHMNAGYTFRTTKLFHPYVKAGYGIGNTATVYYVGTLTSVIGAEE